MVTGSAAVHQYVSPTPYTWSVISGRP
jgi:hypothetical protein